MSFDMIIQLEDLTRHYEMGGVQIKALDGVDIEINRGEYISIVGPSGSGKTTLFNLVGGLDRPTRGKVYIDGVDMDEGLEKAQKLLTSVGLGERVHHRPGELSAGQQQRVAIARAMANDPAIILADEPTGNLDLNTGMEIIDLLHGLNKTRGMTLIAATHDLKMITASDRVVWMRDGAIEKIERG